MTDRATITFRHRNWKSAPISSRYLRYGGLRPEATLIIDAARPEVAMRKIITPADGHRRARCCGVAVAAEPISFAFPMICSSIIFELPISERLYPPGATPLAVAIVSYDPKGEYDAAARIALLGLFGTGALARLVVAVLQRLAAPRRILPA